MKKYAILLTLIFWATVTVAAPKQFESPINNLSVHWDTQKGRYLQRLLDSLTDKLGVNFDTVADLQADTLTVGSVYSANGYYAAGDTEPILYRVVSGDSSDGYCDLLVNGGSDTAVLQVGEYTRLRQCGALYDGSDETAKLVAAMGKSDKLYVDGPIYAPGLAVNDNVDKLLFGPGRISGAYGRYVIPFGATSPPVLVNNDFDPAKLAQLNSTTSPVVILTGDSISTTGAAGAKTRMSVITSAIENKLQNSFESPVYYNRAISGQDYAALDGIPSLFPEWYTNPADPWLDYLEALSPDAIIFNFGMNDSDTFSSVAFRSVIAKIEAWTKVPSLIFITNLVPSKSGNEVDEFTWGIDAQEGRDFCAGYVRTYAQFHGHLLIDINRQQHRAAHGFDIVTGTIGEPEEAIVPVDTGSFLEITTTRQVYNVGYDFKINEAVFAGLSLTDSTISLRVGASGNDVVRIRNNGGFYQFSTNSGSDGTTVDNLLLTTQAVGAGITTMHVQKFGNYVTCYIFDGVKDKYSAPLFTAKIIHTGGLFTPIVRGKTGTAVITTGDIYFDVPNLFTPTINDTLLWGGCGVDGLPYSGNCYNHPSTNAFYSIYNPALSGVNFVVKSDLTFDNIAELKAN